MRKLFIVGCPRSGTTMLQQALNRHPRIIIPAETAYFVDLVGHSRRGQAQHLRIINEDLGINLSPPARRIATPEQVIISYDSIAYQYVSKLERSTPAYFGDKTPHHLFKLATIRRYVPDAKFIIIYRDGRDVAVSKTDVAWGPNDLYVNFNVWLRSYRAQRRAQRTPGLDLLCVKYEELVVNPEEQLRRITEFLGVPYHESMATGSGNVEGVPRRERAWKGGALEKISDERIGAGVRRLSHRQRYRLERWGGRALMSLGYELTTDAVPGLPLGLIAEMYARHTLWRMRCAARMFKKEVVGR